ncbi:MAG TPA: glycosyltransferase family 39 protein [Candidatus Saccharimonadales bacterium]|nr:glycosyltransferase family 39 protein [Candidatus Saccharimonadales bacterium]
MKNKNIWILLLGIVILAAILRFWQLGNIPSSPDWDEVAYGYNAYSLIQTGRDEYGKFLPVVLRSFDDYKPALYVYLVIPAELLFGVTTLAVRFPSAVFGVITIFAVFFLIRELFKRNDVALLVAFLLAISPWHIQFSRLGFETNIGLALNIFAALFFLKGLKKPWLFSLSAISAALAIYAYQSEKVFTPLFMLSLILIYRKALFAVSKKYLITAIILGVIVVLPMATFILTDKAALLRVKGTSIFNSPTEYLKDDAQRLNDDHIAHDYLGILLDNRRLVYAREIIGGYLSHYDINWLTRGDIARHHAPQMGLVYIVEIPLILIGIYMLLFGKFDKKTKVFIFTWFLLAPIPASITTGVPHAVRTLNFLPTWQIFSAIGLVWLIQKISQMKFKYIFFGVFGIAALINFGYYLDQYFVQLNYYDAKDWQYGYTQAVPFVDQIKGKYKKVIVSEKEPLDKSYMFFLFYLKYNPSQYQIIGAHSSGGFAEDHHFEDYSFRPLHWDQDKNQKNVLFVGSPDEFPGDIHTIKTIKYPDGTPAMKVVSR